MRKYNLWSNEEMEALSCGIEKYGLGNWNSILEDPTFGFHLINRSKNDLKAKFRFLTMKNKATTSRNDKLEKGKKIYKTWNYEEEEALLRGIEQYGLGKWQKILEDPEFGFYLMTRSIRDLQNKCRKIDIKNKITALKEKCRKSGIQKNT